MKRFLIVAALAVAGVLFAMLPGVSAASSPSAAPTTVGGAAGASSTAGKVILRIGIPEDVDGMNPFSAWSSITWEAFRLNYDFITWYNDRYQPTPDLAESWSTSADGKTWTFKIRQGVTWQDGQPLTAHDIAFTYNYILENDLGAYTGYLTHVTSVTAPDDQTVVIRSSKPNAGMLALYIPILPEHIWKDVPKNKIDSWINVPTIGSGPFQVTEMKKGHWVKMVANKDYFGGRPTIDEIWFEVYQSADSMIADYRAGNLDAIADVPATNIAGLKSMPGSAVAVAPAIGFHEMGFNCWDSPKSKGNPLLRDWRLRNAIAWAIDKQKIVDAAMAGLAQPGTSVISPLVPWHWEPPADQKITYNPEKAKQLLAAAGYIDRNGDGIREAPNGKPLDFRLTPLNEYPEDIAAAKLISAWLKDVGIKTRIQTMTEAAFGDAYWAGDMDIYFWSWGGDIDPGFMLSCFTTDQIHNWSDCYYSNPVYDKLYVQQAGAVDPANPSDTSLRKAITDRMQQILYEQQPYNVLWYNVNLQAYRTDRFTGWHLVPPGNGAPLWNFMRTTYLNLKPVTAASAASGGNSSTWIWVVVAVGAAVVVLTVVLLRRRPRHVEED